MSMTCITVFSTILCYGFKCIHRLPLVPTIYAAERLRANGDAVGGIPSQLKAAARRGRRRRRGLRRPAASGDGCRAGRMSFGGEGDGRISWGLPNDVREKDLEDLFYK